MKLSRQRTISSSSRSLARHDIQTTSSMSSLCSVDLNHEWKVSRLFLISVTRRTRRRWRKLRKFLECRHQRRRFACWNTNFFGYRINSTSSTTALINKNSITLRSKSNFSRARLAESNRGELVLGVFFVICFHERILCSFRARSHLRMHAHSSEKC